MARLLFHGGLVLDGTGAAPAEADVVVEGDRIVDVGVGLDGDEVVDTTGLTVLPGLFDCHTHVTMSGELDPMRRSLKPFSTKYFEAVDNLRRTLDIGVTTVREAGGADLGVKTAVETGMVAGPHMQISITMLSQTGGHADSHLPSGACLRSYIAYPGNPSPIVDGPDEMRLRVRELIREGADVIKVATSGGVLSPRDDPKHGHFRSDELDVLVAEASAAGLFVMAHAQATDGIANAVRAGIRSIEHGIYLDDPTVEMMLGRGTWLVPTLLAPASVLAAADRGVNVSEWALRKTHEVIAVHKESFRQAVAAGVKVAMGTDSGVGPHGHNLEELELMVDNSDMKPIDAWVATTSSAAALLGVADDRGSIEPGKRADLALLSGDPENLHDLASRITGVWKDGVRHK